jgi:hypothetical protein
LLSDNRIGKSGVHAASAARIWRNSASPSSGFSISAVPVAAAARAHGGARLRRDQDRGRRDVTAPQLGQQIEPVQARQLVIEHEAARVRERRVL